MGLGGRYARAPGAVGRKLLPGVPGREQTVGRGDRRGRLLRDCAQRSLGAEKHVAGRHQKEGESSGAWPYSDNFLFGFGGEIGLVEDHGDTCYEESAPVRILPFQKARF